LQPIQPYGAPFGGGDVILRAAKAKTQIYLGHTSSLPNVPQHFQEDSVLGSVQGFGCTQRLLGRHRLSLPTERDWFQTYSETFNKQSLFLSLIFVTLFSGRERYAEGIKKLGQPSHQTLSRSQGVMSHG
jgi:hypothetical protein